MSTSAWKVSKSARSCVEASSRDSNVGVVSDMVRPITATFLCLEVGRAAERSTLLLLLFLSGRLRVSGCRGRGEGSNQRETYIRLYAAVWFAEGWSQLGAPNCLYNK